MKKNLLMLAVVALLVSPVGCGACRNRLNAKSQAIAAPACVSVAPCAPTAQYAPMCAPACGNCGNCNQCGPAGPVSYGYGMQPEVEMMGPTSMVEPKVGKEGKSESL